MLNAIFHWGHYLLLPEAFATFGDFMADLRSRELPATYEMILLKEENRITASGKVVPGFCQAAASSPATATGPRRSPLTTRRRSTPSPSPACP